MQPPPAPLPNIPRPQIASRRIHDASQQQIGLSATLNRTRTDRRSFSGAAFASVFFEGRYRNLRELHSYTYGGLNAITSSTLPGATFRSSLPATPVATPIRSQPMVQFTEQAIHNRLCGNQKSPMKIRSIFNQTPSKFAHLQSSRARDLDYDDDTGSIEIDNNQRTTSSPVEMDCSSPKDG